MAWPSTSLGTELPQARAGALDLRQWNFATEPAAALAGEWEFTWGRFIDPLAPHQSTQASQLLNVPGSWHGLTVDAKPLDSDGFATYRLQIACGPLPELFLALPVQHSAMVLFVNGREVARQGQPGSSAATSSPAIAARYLPLGAAACPLNVVAHVSNFDHRRGGLVRGIELVTRAEMEQRREQGLIRDVAALTGVGIMSFLPILFFLWRRKEWALLYFGLYCLSSTLFIGLSGERVLLPLFGGLGWNGYLTLVFLTFYGGLALFAEFVYTLHPAEFGKRPIWLVRGLAMGGALLVLFTPARVFTESVPLLVAGAAVLPVYMIYVLVRATGSRSGSPAILLCGFVVMAIAIGHDTINFRNLLSSYWTPFGLLGFALAPGIMLAKRVSRALAAEELRAIEQQERNNLLVRATKAGLLDWDATAQVVTCSERYLEILGYPLDTPPQALPDFKDLIHPEDKARVMDGFVRELRDRSVRSAIRHHSPASYRMRRHDGSFVWVHSEGIALIGDDGRTLRFICSLTDITDAKRQQIELSNQAKFIADVFDTVPMGLALRGLDQRYLIVNRTWEQYVGMPREAVIGETLQERAPPEELAMIEALDREVLALGPGATLGPRENTLRGRRYAQTRTAMTDSEGKLIGILVASMDIHEKYLVEQSLALERERLQLLVRATKAGFGDWDAANDVVTYSARYKEMLGYPADADTSGWPSIFEIMHPEDRERAKSEFREMIRRKSSSHDDHPGKPMAYRLQKADGSYIWIHAEGIAQIDSTGRTRRFITSYLDITSFREQEEALRVSRDQLAQQAAQMADRVKFINDLVDALPIALAMRDTGSRFVFANLAWERYYGLPRDSVIGKTARELMTAEEADQIESLDRAAMLRGPNSLPESADAPFRGRHYTQTRTVMTNARGEAVGVVMASVDVTERRLMEESLATEQRRIALVVRAAQAGIVDWDGRTRTAFYSARLRELLGYPGDADTSAWPEYFSMIHPDDSKRVQEAFSSHIIGKGPAGAQEFHEAIEYRLRCADGSYVWVQGMGVSVRDHKGYATRFIASITDVTERRAQEQALHVSHDQIAAQAAQLELQNEALKENVRLREEVERIARHDIKTPLNSIIAVPRLLREERRLTREADELLGIVERAGYRILSMVNLSLDLYKMEQGSYIFRPDAVDLVDLIDKIAVDIRSHAASKNVRLQLPDRASGAFAWAEELLCYSLIANLLKNAVEASPEGATVTASLQAEPGTGKVALCIHNHGAVPIAVRDSFFTKYATAGKASGTGLGTYSARLMARTQDGDVTMKTSAVHGTSVTVELRAAPEGKIPATVRHAGERAHPPQLAPAHLTALKVLLVDDDEYNLLIVRRFLPVPPLTVLTAFNGRVALEVALEQVPDIIFMDLDMPVMGGLEAIERLRAQEIAAGLARCFAVVLSSHDDALTMSRCLAAGFDHYLVKPVTRELIQRTLMDYCSAAGGRNLPTPLVKAGVPPDWSSAPHSVEVEADIASLLPEFMASRQGVFDSLATALQAGDAEAVRRTVHQLTGSLALYGFTWGADLVKQIERRFNSGEAQAAAAMLESLRVHLRDVCIVVVGEPAE